MLDSIENLVKEKKKVVTEDMTVKNLKRFIKDGSDFIVFGASEGGRNTKKLLERIGKRVEFFLDNDPKKSGIEMEGIKIYNPSEISEIRHKVLISSVWFIDIAKQLSQVFGLKPMRDYVPLFDIILFLAPFMDSSLGYDFILNVEENAKEYHHVYEMLVDDRSRDIYLKLINYRMLAMTPALIKKEELPYDSNLYESYPSRMQEIAKGLPDELGDLKGSSAAHLALKSYRFEDVKRGDIVIDGGAWKGDSAYWFSRFAGKEGKVFSFEPGEIAYDGLKSIVERLGLRENIIPVKMGLSNLRGKICFNEVKESTIDSFIHEDGKSEIELTTIDMFIEENGLKKVNFIKLDVEGNEIEAILGGRKTIEQFKPNLAICMYHKAEHLYKIPILIKNINKDYNIYIDHYDITPWETVCYAVNK